MDEQNPAQSDTQTVLVSRQGNLKVGITNTKRDGKVQRCKAKYIHGVSHKMSKNSLLKKMLAATIQGFLEFYTEEKIILYCIDFEHNEGVTQVDIKFLRCL